MLFSLAILSCSIFFHSRFCHGINMSLKKKKIETEPQSPEPEKLEIVRKLNLEPGDRYTFSMETHVPLPLPDEFPLFKLEPALKKVKSVCRSTRSWNWKMKSVPEESDAISPEEAMLWLAIITGEYANPQENPSKTKPSFTEFKFVEIPRPGKMFKLLAGNNVNWYPEVVYFLRYLYTPEEILEMLIALGECFYSVIEKCLIGLSHYLLPYMDAETLVRLHGIIKENLSFPIKLPPADNTAHISVYLATLFDFSVEFEKTLSALPDNYYQRNDCKQLPMWLILGLHDEEKIVSEMNRFGLSVPYPDMVPNWIGMSGFGGMEILYKWIDLRFEDACLFEYGLEMLEMLLEKIDSPETAVYALRLRKHPKAASLAGEYLEKHPGNAICGILPLVNEKGKIGNAAIEFLRIKKRQAYGPFIEECLSDMPPETVQTVKKEILDHEEIVYPVLDMKNAPEEFRNAFEDVSSMEKIKLPNWIAPEKLPPLLLEKAALSGEDQILFLKSLKASDFGNLHPLANVVGKFVTEKSLADFLWKLFETWLEEGGANKENWAMKALGFLGNDDIALKLASLIRVWPGESLHQRAVLGLNCLRAIGTDTALMQLNGIAQKLKFQGLKKQAASFMEDIARSRGLSREELEDRIVPDCDLDENGKRVFDFGVRKFEFALGPDMKPMIRGEDGKLKTDLPKPNSKDDPETSEAAIVEWKRLKKQIREVVNIQSLRLEEAMISGRSWSPKDFELMLVRHPLMSHLVRTLIWGTFDEKWKLVDIFRVSDEKDYADANDDLFTIPEKKNVRIRVVHTLNLDEKQKQDWSRISLDYELIPPFPQLGRDVHFINPKKKNETNLNEEAIGKISGSSLNTALEKSGWQKAIPGDGGCYYEHSKPFYGANVTAICQYDPGLFPGGAEYWEDQTVTNFFFIPGIYTPSEWYPEHKKRLKLKDVDPIVISESLGFLLILGTKINFSRRS